jgi:hypothetical protein
MPRRIAVLALLSLSACNRSPEPPPPPGDVMVMRAYDVPPAYAPELAGVVNRLLWRGQNEPRLGNAETAPGGQLLVSAPAGVHPGIEQIVSHLRDAPPAPPAPPPTVELTYWAVAGSPAQATSAPATLDEIKPALDAVTKAEGPRAFTVLEKLRARSLAGEKAQVQGSFVAVNQVASARDGKVTASVEIRAIAGGSGIETKVQLDQDALLVLGQAGLDAKDEPGRSVYYVVRAHVAE